jgi:outer membrane protein OmpA-like peptidoglycan-associated protein
MIRSLCAAVVLVFLAAPACPVQAQQTTDELIQLLLPKPVVTQPGLRELPFGKKTDKGVEFEGEDKPPSVDLHIAFEFNSDKLMPDAIITLRRLGDALKDPRLAQYRFKIGGHADAKGTAEYNQKLSERRAQAVRDYLIFQYDLTPDRFETAGYGFSQLADPTHPEDGINRRVQVTNIGK